MTEPTSVATGAVSATATGAVAAPFLAAMGVDVHALLFGLLGAVVVQCLLPDASRTLRQVAMLTVGGMLLAGITTPLAMSYAADYLARMPVQATHNVVAAAIGGFAQPIVLTVRNRLVAMFGSRKPDAAAPQPPEKA